MNLVPFVATIPDLSPLAEQGIGFQPFASACFHAADAVPVAELYKAAGRQKD